MKVIDLIQLEEWMKVFYLKPTLSTPAFHNREFILKGWFIKGKEEQHLKHILTYF